MRIGLVTADFHPNVGGVAAHVVELGKALSRLGHAVHVITLPLGDESCRQSEWQGMTVHRLALPKMMPFYSWGLGLYLGRLVDREDLDLLHVHGLRPLPATAHAEVPVFFTNHTSGFLKRLQKGPREHAKLRRRMAHCSGVLAPSRELLQAAISVGYAGPTAYIPNAVDTGRFTPGESLLRGDWRRSCEDVVVLLARRLVEKNGVCIFAEAIARIASPQARFVFAGDGPERSRVERILRAASCLDRCLFLGNLSNTQMPDVYRAADVSVLPSFMEATSITGLESMATGLPLVGTRVGGIPDLIQEGETGFLVEPGNPIELAATIEELIQSPGLRKFMGTRARKIAVQFFSWDRIATRTVEFYESHLGAEHHGAAA